MAARGISLTRFEEAVTSVPSRGECFRIKIQAVDEVMMPAEVFLFKENLLDPISGLTSHEFSAVASPEDLVTYPVGAPEITDLPPYFRKSLIDAIVPSRAVAEELWEAVHERVCILVEALNRKDRLVERETVRCGDPLVPATSESMSMSASTSI